MRIEVDIMSGRPNPEWILTDADQVNELLGAVASAPGAAAKIDAGIEAVTVASANAALRKYLNPAGFAWSYAGDFKGK